MKQSLCRGYPTLKLPHSVFRYRKASPVVAAERTTAELWMSPALRCWLPVLRCSLPVLRLPVPVRQDPAFVCSCCCCWGVLPCSGSGQAGLNYKRKRSTDTIVKVAKTNYIKNMYRAHCDRNDKLSERSTVPRFISPPIYLSMKKLLQLPGREIQRIFLQNIII